jgi:hypothetical protein
MAAASTADAAREKAKDSSLVEALARLGLVTRGMLHVVVGWLALRIVSGEPQRRADKHGALETLVHQPLGRVLVGALAVGFLGYASWRLIDAVLDPSDDGWFQRVGRGMRGTLYLGFFVTALRYVFGGSSSSTGGSSTEQDVTATVLGWPFGRVLVAVAGVVLIGMGLWNGWRGVSRTFETDLKHYEMSSAERRWTMRVGTFGLLARLVAYVLCGGFVVRAALRFDPKRGVGLDASLHELAAQPSGPWMLAVVGAGLVSFGLYQFMLARYRQILED